MLILNQRDVTRAKYKKEAWLLQTRCRDVLEAWPDATVLVDSTGRIVFANLETERLFGYEHEELPGEFVELVVPAFFDKRHPDLGRMNLPKSQSPPMGMGVELSGRRKDGSEFSIEISLSPLSLGKSLLAVAAIRDLTRRKKTEEVLRTANAAANAELEAFTYSVSHDLRAPIRQMEGFSKILGEHLGKDIDPETAQCLRRIREASLQMGELVDDLLQLSHVDRQDPKPRLISLSSLARDVLTNVRAEIADRDIEWRVEQLPEIVCDPGLIHVVLTNLLSNAIKYTRPRAKAVIEIGRIPEDGPTVFFVRDNGVGFDMKYADRLFGVFQRLHRPEEFEGTGVGLATVHRIIRKHGGRIWAESAPDKGATFFFTLGGNDAPRPAIATK